MNHFISITDATREELLRIFDVAFTMRQQRRNGEPNDQVLSGKTLSMIFEKPSLRTRASFEQAVVELGGHAMNLQGSGIGLGKRESAPDVARVLSGMVHGIAARVFEHQKLNELTCHATVPVVNLLSDQSHPCQALADAMTIMDEFGHDLMGRTITFVGDGNNVARSVLAVCAMMDMRFVMACPPGYELPDDAVSHVRAHVPTMDFCTMNDPVEAVRGADVVYTDTWVSMGQEGQIDERYVAFKEFQVNTHLLEGAAAHAIVLHCLPAYRGVEITDEVIDGPQSRVFPEAHNRLHAQKGLLAVLIGGAG